jgi:deazaflavin-dependent oxidoreductase (nitroreductase family)
MLYGQEHVDRYIETGGEEGYSWRNGAPILILTTTGRKTGASHSTPLIFGRHGDDYLIVGSMGGAPKPPKWYLNLQANPDVHVQVKGDRFAAHARTAADEEKPELWKTMTSVWPDYDVYQTRTTRVIPVVVLTRA